MRMSRQQYYMEITKIVAARSTCPRARVGAILVDPKTKRIVAAGYNGGVKGSPHCDDVGCLMMDGHCIRTIHAEANSVLYLEKRYGELVLYSTHCPCLNCLKMLVVANVKEIYYIYSYIDIGRVKLEEEFGTRVKLERIKIWTLEPK